MAEREKTHRTSRTWVFLPFLLFPPKTTRLQNPSPFFVSSQPIPPGPLPAPFKGLGRESWNATLGWPKKTVSVRGESCYSMFFFSLLGLQNWYPPKRCPFLAVFSPKRIDHREMDGQEKAQLWQRSRRILPWFPFFPGRAWPYDFIPPALGWRCAADFVHKFPTERTKTMGAAGCNFLFTLAAVNGGLPPLFLFIWACIFFNYSFRTHLPLILNGFFSAKTCKMAWTRNEESEIANHQPTRIDMNQLIIAWMDKKQKLPLSTSSLCSYIYIYRFCWLALKKDSAKFQDPWQQNKQVAVKWSISNSLRLDEIFVKSSI